MRHSIGLVFQDSSLDDRLTGRHNLNFHALVYNVPAAVREKRIEQVLRMVDLWDKRNNFVGTYSGGMKRRLELARGLLHYPKVLFLDEPTLGLDGPPAPLGHDMNTFLGVYTMWYRDVLRFWYDKTRMLSALLFPLFFLFMFGSGLQGSIGMMSGGINFTQFMFPGIIAMSVLMGSFMSGVSIVWDREFGFLKEVLVAPISRVSVALGRTLDSATVATIQGIMILVLAPFIHVSLSVWTVWR